MYLALDKKTIIFHNIIILTFKEQSTFTKQYTLIDGSVIIIYYKQFKSIVIQLYTPNNNGPCCRRFFNKK